MAYQEKPKLEEYLGEGKHIIKVWKQREWDKEKKEWIPDTHKTGESASGWKWWMYNTKIDDIYLIVWGNEKNKKFLDTGEVEVEIAPRKNPDGSEMYIKHNGEIEPVLGVQVNPVPKDEVKIEDVDL